MGSPEKNWSNLLIGKSPPLQAGVSSLGLGQPFGSILSANTHIGAVPLVTTAGGHSAVIERSTATTVTGRNVRQTETAVAITTIRIVVIAFVGVTPVNTSAVIPPANVTNLHTPTDAARVMTSSSGVANVHPPAGTSKRTAAAAKAAAPPSNERYDPDIIGIAF